MMHEHGKSAPAVVAVKPTNKAGRPATEPVEPRAGTKGNAGQQNAHRAQDRESTSNALDRIRRVAGKGRRRSSPRSSTTSVSSFSKRRSTNLRRMPHPERMG